MCVFEKGSCCLHINPGFCNSINGTMVTRLPPARTHHACSRFTPCPISLLHSLMQKVEGSVKDANPTWPSHLPTPPYVKSQPATNGSLSPAAQPFVGPPNGLPQLNQQPTGEATEKHAGTGDLEILLPASAMPADKSANGINSEASTEPDPEQPPPGQDFGGPAMMPMLPGMDPNGVYYANGFAPAQYFYDFTAGEGSCMAANGDYSQESEH